MPQGFTTLRNSALSSNSHGLTQNCYYCTIAALLGTTTDELVAHTETMQQDTANAGEIVSLMNEAGIPGAAYASFTNREALNAALNSLPPNTAVGVAYTRANGSGHMVVAARNASGQTAYIDYQNNPPTVTADIPEAFGTIIGAHIFYRA